MRGAFLYLAGCLIVAVAVGLLCRADKADVEETGAFVLLSFVLAPAVVVVVSAWLLVNGLGRLFQFRRTV